MCKTIKNYNIICEFGDYPSEISWDLKKDNNIILTGGAGYCGSKLIPILLDTGHEVTVYDILYFGSNFLPLENKNLKLIKGDIRDSKKIEFAFFFVNFLISFL